MNNPNRIRERSFPVLVATVCLLAATTWAGAPASLTNGVAVTGLSGAAGSEVFFTIEVPAGQDSLKVTTTGGTGDVDLYVRRGSQPTTTAYDYRGYTPGNNEAVDVNNPAAGTWYVLLKGYSAYDNVTLKATYSSAVSVKALANGVAVTGIGGAANAELYYSIEVPAGQTKLDIAMSGGTGDADLYVRKGSLPTTSTYDYRPYLSGNNETVSVNNPAAGTWYIMIRGYSLYAGINLLASYTGSSTPTTTTLNDGVPVTNLSGAAGAELLYQIDLPAGVSSLEIKMSGGTGDADLYVRIKTPPTTTDYDYRPYQAGNNETVTINTPAAGTWFVMVQGYTPFSGVTLTASWGGGVTTLQSEVPVKNLSGALGSEKFFKIDVPSGMDLLEFVMSGGTGDADMYIKQGAKPTTTSYDFRPYDDNNNESISITSTALPGTWYVLLKGDKAYDGVTLTGKYSKTDNTTPQAVALSNGVPVTNIAGAAGAEKYYKIDVPAGQEKLEISISGGTGDADLYVRKGSLPTTSDFDYRPYLIGNNESVAVDHPAAGTWYIMLRGYQTFAGITLLATYGGGVPPETVTTLQNGVPVAGLKGAAASETFYKITVPAGQATLEIATSGGTGDVDLYVKKDAKPTASDWDYRPYLIGNNETVTITNPTAATYYIMLKGYSAYDGVTLKATYTPAPEPIVTLTNGVGVTGLSGGQSSATFYKIDVPAGQDLLTIETSGGTGDVDLYVKKGSKPSTTSWDYRPYLIGNNEKVQVSNPAAATWYILLQGYQAYAGLTLKATYGVNTPPAPAGNNFASDPNCVALWRFESGQVGTDSVGTNNMKNSGVTANTANKKEGVSAGGFKASEKDFLTIADANLAAGFPLRSTSTATGLTVCAWVRLDTLPASYDKYTVAAKWSETQNQRSFWLNVANDTPADGPHFQLYIGAWYGYQLAANVNLTDLKVQAGRWYHVAVTIDNTLLTYKVRVWDDTAGTMTENRGSLGKPMVYKDAPWEIGRVFGWTGDPVYYFNGQIDELVVFKSLLTADETDQIRQGIYTKAKKK